ncbi:MAG: alkaline phosphatase family protein [Clostridia bacterium]|nr:alkaline phosphatase family protein [Clostridia bacterium]
MLPDYQKSILSITSSVAAYFGAKTPYPPLEAVTAALMEKNTKNVVLLLFDGMGENLLKRHLQEDAFLRKHDVGPVSTVYPSTTTAATTSLWTGVAPGEHAWLGWSLYFKEIGRQIDTFLGKDSFTGEKYAPLFPAEAYIPFETIYPSVNHVCQTHAFFPFPTSASKGANDRAVYSGATDLFRRIVDAANRPGKQLIAVYHPEPDTTMHERGVNALQTKTAFERANDLCEKLSRELGDDTLFIVTADHGLVDVNENIDVTKIPEIMQTLIMPPSIEGRAASFFVKPHKKDAFLAEFEKRFKDDFIVFTHDEAMKNQLLGIYPFHGKTDDFIGDFFICATGEKSFAFSTPASINDGSLIGQHAGLTEDEMLVPVICFRGSA